MRVTLPRLSAAAQDTTTAIIYLVAWISPYQLDPGQFRGLLAAIVVEFLVLHASAFYGLGIAKREDRLARRAWILGILTALYVVPIVGIVIQLKTIGPLISFLWLFTSRFGFTLLHPVSAASETRRQITLWVVSLASFFVGVVLMNELPLPAFGLTPAFVASLSLSGHPNPSAQPPQITIAFGVFYFIVQACAKFYLCGDGSRDVRKW